jgi:hypothetical protein
MVEKIEFPPFEPALAFTGLAEPAPPLPTVIV